MNVAITGASGYIGKNLVRTLEKENHNITILSRPTFTLGKPVDSRLLQNIDVLVHCAYDFAPKRRSKIMRVNVKGTQKLLLAAKKMNTHVIILSTMSITARSKYAIAKRAIEKLGRKFGATIVRPGLVYGRNGGMLANVKKQLSLGVVPVVAGGRQPQYLCHIDDLCSLILVLLKKKSKKPIVAAQEQPMTFREIVEKIAKKKIFFVSLPYGFYLNVIHILEFFHIGSFRADSLVGLVTARPNPDFSPTRKLKVTFREIK